MKKAIILASFGTTYINTRQKTIDRIVEDIKNEFQDFDIFEAYTSSIVRKRVKENEGIEYLSVEDKLEELIGKGYEKIYIQPSHIIPGWEYGKVLRAAEQYEHVQVEIRVSTPLLYEQEDYERVVDNYTRKYDDLGPDEAVLYMSHGTETGAFTSYTTLDYMFRGTNIFTSCVEGYPELHISIENLKKGAYRKVHLYPFMIVAGDHAHNDMAGKNMDSWQGQLEAEGFEVAPHMEGLGEDEFIRRIFIDKLANTIGKVEA